MLRTGVTVNKPGDQFRKLRPSPTTDEGRPKTGGELVAEVTGGANLVRGKQTWEYADEGKHDLETMKECCDAELRTMEEAGLVPAPYYFERVAILSRKAELYQQEVDYCTRYISAVDSYYANRDAAVGADVRKGSRYAAIVKRLPKAQALLARQDGHFGSE